MSHICEPQPPQSLTKLQEWFASIITQPIDDQSQIAPLTPRGAPIEKEAAIFIKPSPALKSYQRIEIYNQQYWWRLLKIMQETYPLAVRLFSYEDFNRTLATPYLQKYFPNHWSLSLLGDRLPQWVEEEYHADDKELITHSVAMDHAYNRAFFSLHYPALSLEDLQGANSVLILNTKLHLQPHVRLFKMPFDLFAFRKELMKESPEYWVENDFPQLKKDRTYHFLVYRRRSLMVTWKEISPTEYALLEQFSLGASVDVICQWIETQPETTQQEAESHLSAWFQDWSAEGILTKVKQS
ncbi:MAG: HvfC/BufC family peptide modification chaperone [Parachlamydiaceae bacterium]